jgi:hypothetical protein
MITSSAPVPAATMCAIWGRTSSLEYAPPTRLLKSDSTSYGVARRPYTTRFASRAARWRSGWNATATIAAARADSSALRRLPTSVPTPATRPT